jgi:cyclopropane-fatty-acyl-phospholipid synthase
MEEKAKKEIQKILDVADIKIDGNNPWDIQVKNPKLYSRVLSGGSLAFGEAYMDGWWEVERLDEFFSKLFAARLDKKIITAGIVFEVIKSKLTNNQTFNKSKQVAEQHYDLGNSFYEKMLDKNMQYTCGYWKTANNLAQAQEDKLKLICNKLQLKKGDKVLELGCGWGGFAKFAAKNYGCHVTAYNISKEQVEFAREKCKSLPVEIVHKDYRLAEGVYDAVVSVGLCEHVGHKNYRVFMEVVHRCLKDKGLFLLHTIGKDESAVVTDPWISKYIFPNSMLPSCRQLMEASEKLFIMEDWHNIGTNYDKTLMAWHSNFEENWHLFKAKYGDRFYRMWRYYLLSCAGLFRARRAQLWQIVLSKGGVPDGYNSIR